jgi:hypothetical protein
MKSWSYFKQDGIFSYFAILKDGSKYCSTAFKQSFKASFLGLRAATIIFASA